MGAKTAPICRKGAILLGQPIDHLAVDDNLAIGLRSDRIVSRNPLIANSPFDANRLPLYVPQMEATGNITPYSTGSITEGPAGAEAKQGRTTALVRFQRLTKRHFRWGEERVKTLGTGVRAAMALEATC